MAAGGWLHNPAVLEAKQRQYPGMRTTEVAEPGAYGAALLAAAAAGHPIHAVGEPIHAVGEPIHAAGPTQQSTTHGGTT